MKYLFLILFFAFLSSFSCNKKPADKPVPPITIDTSSFAKGADVSWVTQMESQGIKFYNKNSAQQDLYQILKDE